MTKESFTKYSPLKNGNRSLDEAISEIQREMDVRRRLFDRWVSEGRMSWVDAHDRLERQCTALKQLIAVSNAVNNEHASHINPTPFVPVLSAEESLDNLAAERAA